jgi:nucleotide-binding universal stress UspA family protein
MTRILVPVRYPLNENSVTTLREAVRIARERGADLTVLHVDLFHDGKNVSRRDLELAVEEEEVGGLETVSNVVRRGLLVEETILEEAAAEDADVVVIGSGQAGRWRRMLRRVTDDPDIERVLQNELDVEVVTASTD